jgi:hypothetical protein
MFIAFEAIEEEMAVHLQLKSVRVLETDVTGDEPAA